MCLEAIILTFISCHKHGVGTFRFFPMSIFLKDSSLHQTKLYITSGSSETSIMMICFYNKQNNLAILITVLKCDKKNRNITS